MKSHEKMARKRQKHYVLGSVFGRTDFRGFLLLGRRIFFCGFCRRFFLIFCGERCPEKSSRKVPGKILQNRPQQKSPTCFCRGTDQYLSRQMRATESHEKATSKNVTSQVMKSLLKIPNVKTFNAAKIISEGGKRPPTPRFQPY